MSEASLLSHEYQAAADLAQTLNEALIVVKRVHWHLPGAEDVSAEALDKARQTLVGIVSSVATLLGSPGDSQPQTRGISGSLLSRLRTQHSGDLTYYLEDLAHLAVSLGKPESTLSRRDLEILDELATAADAETSSVFRRLMRK